MLTIELPKDVEKKLAERAARSGKTAEVVARELIEQAVRGERTLDEILRPFRDEVAASGISDAELDQLFDEARDEAHAARKGRGA